MFYWIDDTPLARQYSAWDIGEPNNWEKTNECVHMYARPKDRLGNWNDYLCNMDETEKYEAPVVLCQKKAMHLRRSIHF